MTKRSLGAFVALAALACTGVDPAPAAMVVPDLAPKVAPQIAAPAAPEIPSPPPTVRITSLVLTEDGCEWQLQDLPDGATEVVVKLPLPCHGPGFTVEPLPEKHRALIVDQGNHAFLVDLTAKTAQPVPRLPESGSLGIDDKGLVGCAIVADEPDVGRGGALGFELDGQRYPVDSVADGGTSLGRTWRLVDGKWIVKETAVLDSPSPDAGPPECGQMPSFGAHQPLTSYSNTFSSRPVDPADVDAIVAAGGDRGTWVSAGGRYPFAVREEWGEGPYWLGPVYVRSGGGWRVLEGTKDFCPAPDGLVFALVANEWRLYSTVTGELSWRGLSRPFVWPDIAL